MRIIYVHQYFQTPGEGGAIRSYHFARSMVDAGLEVDMVTAHNEEDYCFKIIDGIKVHYLPVPYDNTFGYYKRIFSFFRFVFKAKRLIKKLPRPDLCYISSTPLTTGLIGLWSKKKYALPFIFEVRDLWPEAPVQVGVIRNRLIQAILYQLERKIYLNALKIVALSPGIRRYIRKCCPDKEVFLIPNFCDLQFFQPMKKEASIAHKLGLKECFTITYTGAMGRINALQEFLFLAKEAQVQTKDWQFVLMGKGTDEGFLKQISRDLKLENVYFFPFGNKSQVRDLLSVSDVAYISFAHFPILQTNSPNKFFDALSMGKAILTNQKGWLYNLVRDHRLGFYHKPGEAKKTLQLLEKIAGNPQALQEIQQRARALAARHFSKEMAIQNLLFLIDPIKFEWDTKGSAYSQIV